MADVKVSELTEDTSPTSDDLIMLVDNPLVAPANRKVKLVNLIKGLYHKITHEKNGADEISVTNLSGLLADDQHVIDSEVLAIAEDNTKKDVASGYAGLNASSRITKGVDTTDDLIIDLATKGLVLKDTQGTPHYWRVTINNSGVLQTADLGTVKP